MDRLPSPEWRLATWLFFLCAGVNKRQGADERHFFPIGFISAMSEKIVMLSRHSQVENSGGLADLVFTFCQKVVDAITTATDTVQLGIYRPAV